jgi:hypothetical protein
LSSSGNGSAQSEGDIAFSKLEPTIFASAIEDKRFVAIRNSTDWLGVWNQHVANLKPAPAAPAVDFSQHMVLGVFIGNESVTCGSTNIEKVSKRNNPERIEVGYRITDPGPNVMCIAAHINQHSLVTVPASSLPVEFVKLP